MMDEKNAAIEAAWKVTQFVKTHDYPELHTAEFQELTRLLNNMEIALKRVYRAGRDGQHERTRKTT